MCESIYTITTYMWNGV